MKTPLRELVLSLAVAGAIGITGLPAYAEDSTDEDPNAVDFDGTHYLCYEVKRGKRNRHKWDGGQWHKVIVWNQFTKEKGLYLEVGKPTQLCLPTKKKVIEKCNKGWGGRDKWSSDDKGHNCDDSED